MRLRLPFIKNPPLVAVIRLSGAIGMAGRGALNAHAVNPILEKAFRRGRPDAVAIELNSPGGSPVQSSLIASRIRSLANELDVPVFAFVEDVAASGGYWLACAADEIWADRSSILGSIGVISAGFGASVLLARQGIERRVHTAGKSKSMLDPFRPEKEEDVVRLQGLLDTLHTTFIDQVKERRGDKLDLSEELFTGDVWLAQRGIELGLIDGIGHLKSKMKERFGDKVQFRRYGLRRPFLGRLGAQVVDDTIAGLEERAAYARFGL
jgi:serine protease SohB